MPPRPGVVVDRDVWKEEWAEAYRGLRIGDVVFNG